MTLWARVLRRLIIDTFVWGTSSAAAFGGVLLLVAGSGALHERFLGGAISGLSAFISYSVMIIPAMWLMLSGREYAALKWRGFDSALVRTLLALLGAACIGVGVWRWLAPGGAVTVGLSWGVVLLRSTLGTTRGQPAGENSEHS
jgi:hypothetical protein